MRSEGLRVIEDMEVEDVADLRVLPGVKRAAGEPAAGAVGDCDLGDAAAAAGAADGCGVAGAGADYQRG